MFRSTIGYESNLDGVENELRMRGAAEYRNFIPFRTIQ